MKNIGLMLFVKLALSVIARIYKTERDREFRIRMKQRIGDQ